MDRYLAAQSYEDLYYLPPPIWLELSSLGHKRAAADLLYMRGLLYTGEAFENKGGMDHVFRYAEAALHLDPDFRSVFTWVGVAGMYRPVEVGAEDIRATIEFLERGTERMPDDGQLWWDLGAALTYELAPHLEGEAREEALESGRNYLRHAARLGAGPAYLASANANELMRRGETEAAIRHLRETYPLVDDPDLRDEMLAQLEYLEAQEEVDTLRAAELRFREGHAENYPWIPASLYMLVGDRLGGSLLPPEWSDTKTSH